MEVAPVNKLYHGLVLIFCGVCCSLSLVAWRDSADTTAQKRGLTDAIGSESHRPNDGISAPSSLSPRIMRAFEQAHRPSPALARPVMLASWSPGSAAPAQPQPTPMSSPPSGNSAAMSAVSYVLSDGHGVRGPAGLIRDRDVIVSEGEPVGRFTVLSASLEHYTRPVGAPDIEAR